jgi:hypothetical protein
MDHWGFEQHSNRYVGEHFMKLCGIEAGNSFPQDRCSKLVHHCKICERKVDPVKAHEHECLKDLLFKVQGKFMIENMASCMDKNDELTSLLEA